MSYAPDYLYETLLSILFTYNADQLFCLGQCCAVTFSVDDEAALEESFSAIKQLLVTEMPCLGALVGEIDLNRAASIPALSAARVIEIASSVITELHVCYNSILSIFADYPSLALCRSFVFFYRLMNSCYSCPL